MTGGLTPRTPCVAKLRPALSVIRRLRPANLKQVSTKSASGAKNWTPVPKNGIICPKAGGGVQFFRVEWQFFAHLSFSARSGRATAGNIYEYAMTTERDIRNQIRYAEKKGIEKGALVIARRMLEEKFDLDTIVRISGLTEEQIKNL